MKKLLFTSSICIFLFQCGAPQLPDVLDVVSEFPVVVPQEKTVVLPTRTLPKGWIMNREELADWNTSLPEVLGIMPDTGATAEYWDDPVTLTSGIKLPVKRAKVTYIHRTRLTNEVVELHFVNIDHIYSVTNYETSHYDLNAVLKSIELSDTRFPQLTADDVLKHKVLMQYGTPKEFDGSWHRYEDKETDYAVRVIDNKHLAIQSHSRLVEKRIKQAIQDVYSEEGIELKKQQLMEGFDL